MLHFGASKAGVGGSQDPGHRGSQPDSRVLTLSALIATLVSP